MSGPFVTGACDFPVPTFGGSRVRRIGYMSGVGLDAEDAALVSSLRQFGWVEGDGPVIERRHYDGRADTAAVQVAELLGDKVEILVTFGSIPTAAAKQRPTPSRLSCLEW